MKNKIEVTKINDDRRIKTLKALGYRLIQASFGDHHAKFYWSKA